MGKEKREKVWGELGVRASSATAKGLLTTHGIPRT